MLFQTHDTALATSCGPHDQTMAVLAVLRVKVEGTAVRTEDHHGRPLERVIPRAPRPDAAMRHDARQLSGPQRAPAYTKRGLPWPTRHDRIRGIRFLDPCHQPMLKEHRLEGLHAGL